MQFSKKLVADKKILALEEFQVVNSRLVNKK